VRLGHQVSGLLDPGSRDGRKHLQFGQHSADQAAAELEIPGPGRSAPLPLGQRLYRRLHCDQRRGSLGLGNTPCAMPRHGPGRAYQ